MRRFPIRIDTQASRIRVSGEIPASNNSGYELASFLWSFRRTVMAGLATPPNRNGTVKEEWIEEPWRESWMETDERLRPPDISSFMIRRKPWRVVMSTYIIEVGCIPTHPAKSFPVTGCEYPPDPFKNSISKPSRATDTEISFLIFRVLEEALVDRYCVKVSWIHFRSSSQRDFSWRFPFNVRKKKESCCSFTVTAGFEMWILIPSWWPTIIVASIEMLPIRAWGGTEGWTVYAHIFWRVRVTVFRLVRICWSISDSRSEGSLLDMVIRPSSNTVIDSLVVDSGIWTTKLVIVTLRYGRMIGSEQSFSPSVMRVFPISIAEEIMDMGLDRFLVEAICRFLTKS